MRLTAIQRISSFRSLEHVGPIALSDITLFVGPNNSGKSSLLQAVLAMQANLGIGASHVRIGTSTATISLEARDAQDIAAWSHLGTTKATISIEVGRGGGLRIEVRDQLVDSPPNLAQLPAEEPDHILVPFLSQRRPDNYAEEIREPYALGVYPDMRFLAAKLSRIGQRAHPKHTAYAEACEQILGCLVTAVHSPNGQLPGVFVGTSDRIPLADMGAGVAQIVGLLADLALSDRKIFVIEEPENDLHPAALRALLDLILQASERNQFLISTHSNLVLRHLGSQQTSRIYYVEADQSSWPPVTRVREVAPEPAARSEVLINLGYELSDFEFFDGWLFLEEASAETLIRDRLIPWFAPGLVGRLRTVSARGASRVRPTFDDFNRLMVFTHLEERYRNRAWVLIDGDEAGADVVDALRATYAATWDRDQFRTLREANIERYYPTKFAEPADAALSEPDGKRRRAAKRALLIEVLDWSEQSPGEAKGAFASSAAEIIDLLRAIESRIIGEPARSNTVA